jgi:hypothetical protein
LSTTLTFLGAAGTVTGSMHLVTAAGTAVLLECGLFRGLKELRLRNWQARVPDPRSIPTQEGGKQPRLVLHGSRAARVRHLDQRVIGPS